MTTLEGEIIRVLEAEGPGRPLRVSSLREVLCCARGLYLADGEIESALEGLLRDGHVEAVHSARLGARYRILRVRPGVDMSEPESAA
jgi:hypothetical protein